MTLEKVFKANGVPCKISVLLYGKREVVEATRYAEMTQEVIDSLRKSNWMTEVDMHQVTLFINGYNALSAWATTGGLDLTIKGFEKLAKKLCQERANDGCEKILIDLGFK